MNLVVCFKNILSISYSDVMNGKGCSVMMVSVVLKTEDELEVTTGRCYNREHDHSWGKLSSDML